MEITIEFLVSKNLIQDDKNAFKRLLHRMWFALYPRSWRTKGSCAFEHVFLGRYSLPTTVYQPKYTKSNDLKIIGKRHALKK